VQPVILHNKLVAAVVLDVVGLGGVTQDYRKRFSPSNCTRSFVEKLVNLTATVAVVDCVSNSLKTVFGSCQSVIVQAAKLDRVPHGTRW